ncbi:MAG: hypothetical protein ACOCVR_00010 [Myxococcota bacterium]
MRSSKTIGKLLLPLCLTAFALACGTGDNGADNGNGNDNGNGENGGDGAYVLAYDGNGHTEGTVPGSVNLDFDQHTEIADPGDFRGPDMQDGIKRRFVGWNTEADGSGDSYQPGEDFYMPDNDLTLFAQWTTGDEVIRNVAPSGGLVFYDKGAASDGWRYMEAAPASTEIVDAPWGAYGTPIEGTSEEIGTGRANTDILVAALDAAGESGTAAQLADSLEHGGYSDWFLPSQHEMRDMLMELAIEDGDVGDFSQRNYWTSTAVEGMLDEIAMAYNGALSTSAPQKRDREYLVRAARTF